MNVPFKKAGSNISASGEMPAWLAKRHQILRQLPSSDAFAKS
jgi:hypothetical protein